MSMQTKKRAGRRKALLRVLVLSILLLLVLCMLLREEQLSDNPQNGAHNSNERTTTSPSLSISVRSQAKRTSARLRSSIGAVMQRFGHDKIATGEVMEQSKSSVHPVAVVDLEGANMLQSVASNRSFDGELVLTIFNKGGAPMALNLAHNMHEHNLHSYTLIGNDENACFAVHAVDKNIACVYTSYLRNDPRLRKYRVEAEHGLAPFRLWWARFYYMMLLAKQGMNVMYVDIDVSFRQNPYTFFRGPLKHHNLFVQRERFGLPGLNIGIFYCQRCYEDTGAHYILSESLRRRDEILDADPPLRNEYGRIASGPKNVLWDQHILNDAAETAAGGFESKRRSMSLLYKPENRESWMKKQGYASVPWKKDSIWKPEHLRFGGKRTEYAWHSLAPLGTNNYSESTLIGPPGWLFGGFSGVIAEEVDQGWWSWWNHDPPPVVMAHLVGSLNKIASMKAYGWWSDAADEVDNTEDARNARLPASRAIVIRTPPLDFSVYGDVQRQYPSIARRIAKLGIATNRRPVMPLLKCTSPWIGRDKVAWSGLREREKAIISKCADGAPCCHSISFTCPRFTFMYPEYERRFHGASVAHVDVTKFSSASTNELTELGKDAAVLEILIGNRTAMDAIPDIQLADEKQNKLTALQSVCGQYLETL